MLASNVLRLKRGLLAFWAVWLTIVLTTNLFDVAKALGLLPPTWAFASGNYGFIVQTTLKYSVPTWLNGLLFVGVIVWQAVAALLLWLALFQFQGRGRAGSSFRYLAYLVNLKLWAAFMIADELCIAYAIEATHVHLFIAQLATVLAVELLPEEG